MTGFAWVEKHAGKSLEGTYNLEHIDSARYFVFVLELTGPSDPFLITKAGWPGRRATTMSGIFCSLRAKRMMGCALLYLLFMAPDLHAQIRSGTITGLATDAKGAVIAGADVTVTNSATHESYSTRTTDTGLYTVPYLATGSYSVSVTKASFETVTVNGLLLNPGATAKADVTLKPGPTATNVEVNAAIQQLQTESSTVSAGVDALAIENIPNITENPLYYTTLENNVQPRNELAMSVGMGTYNNAFGIGVAGRAEFSAIGVNGGRAFTNDIQLDGLPITGAGFNEAAILPNQEGLQEVRVISNNFTADYGHGQAVLEMTTKSGTNAFHGQVNYLMRNDGLDDSRSRRPRRPRILFRRPIHC
jgi:Carboxypeptidase regulatory-like domain